MVAVVATLFLFLIIGFAFSPPRSSYPAFFEVRNGAGLNEIAEGLKKSGIIRSAFLFKTCAFLSEGSRASVAGIYEFEDPLGPCTVALRIVDGRFSLIPIRTTIPEGFSKKDIALRLTALPRFNIDNFMKTAPEGYLFPDTYFFSPSMNETEVIKMMTDNFERKVEPLSEDIEKSNRTLKDIIIVASLVELETKFPEDRPIVAGILWRRLDMKLPLQVDAAFAYINGKGTFELTLDDLKIDSPYNTYRYAGLPPTPISNPGIDSIKAAVDPAKTNYIYFLSDKAGRMYYARTFEEHQVNREKYLGR